MVRRFVIACCFNMFERPRQVLEGRFNIRIALGMIHYVEIDTQRKA